MNKARIIKKYPNRRLYDTDISSYITLEDVKKLVREEIAVKVIDAKTQADITHSTLLQIIMEQEETGPSFFTTESLEQIIRFYGASMQKSLSVLFEQGIKFFIEQQSHLKEKGTQTSYPLQMMTDLTQKHLMSWQNLQQQWGDLWLSHLQKNYPEDKESSGS